MRGRFFGGALFIPAHDEFFKSLYKDICSQFLSEDGAYALIQDRLLDYNYEVLSGGEKTIVNLMSILLQEF